jgi:hypothetical protein
MCCASSFVLATRPSRPKNNTHVLNPAQSLQTPKNAIEEDLAVDLQPFVAFCGCMLEDAQVFCEFRFSTFSFLLLGLIVIYLMEVRLAWSHTGN